MLVAAGLLKGIGAAIHGVDFEILLFGFGTRREKRWWRKCILVFILKIRLARKGRLLTQHLMVEVLRTHYFADIKRTNVN